MSNVKHNQVLHRPFKFSLRISSGILSPSDLIGLAQQAEDLGFSAIGSSDHFDGRFSPLIALSFVAQATNTIDLQPMVLSNDFRHPAVLAKEAATLDVLSGGRFIMAIGAGWMRSDFDQLGIPFDRPSERIGRLGESVKVLKGLFSGESFSFEGDHYKISDMAGSPRPTRRPGPPFLIAGGGRKILSLAAQEADIVGLNPNLGAGVIDRGAILVGHAAATDEQLGWIHESAGPRLDQIEIQTSVYFGSITTDKNGAAEAIASRSGAARDQILDSPHVLIGTASECIERIQSWRERWGISNIGIGSHFMSEMAPVVAALADT